MTSLQIHPSLVFLASGFFREPTPIETPLREGVSSSFLILMRRFVLCQDWFEMEALFEAQEVQIMESLGTLDLSRAGRYLFGRESGASNAWDQLGLARLHFRRGFHIFHFNQMQPELEAEHPQPQERLKQAQACMGAMRRFLFGFSVLASIEDGLVSASPEQRELILSFMGIASLDVYVQAVGAYDRA